MVFISQWDDSTAATAARSSHKVSSNSWGDVPARWQPAYPIYLLPRFISTRQDDPSRSHRHGRETPHLRSPGTSPPLLPPPSRPFPLPDPNNTNPPPTLSRPPTHVQVAHQILRRYETYTFSFYGLALTVPPALIAFLPSHYHYHGSGSGGPAPTVLSFLQCLALYLTTLAASIAAYRLSPFHPLARYPGPVLGKLSGFWMAYVSTGGRQQHYLKALHDRYGDVLRIGG